MPNYYIKIQGPTNYSIFVIAESEGQARVKAWNHYIEQTKVMIETAPVLED